MLYIVGRESELLHFIEKAKARRPAATYPAPTLNLIGRYYLLIDPADWTSIGSLITADAVQKAFIS